MNNNNQNNSFLTPDPEKTYLVRCDRAGVFYGKIEWMDATTASAKIVNARNIHYWDGANALLQLAEEGVKKPSRITMAVPSLVVMGVIEILEVSDAALESLSAQKTWKL